jgi:hypothetical protein
VRARVGASQHTLADTPVAPLPPFANRLLNEKEDDRADILSAEHQDYATNRDHWQIMLDAFEGVGGFQDGEYLWPYRNETRDDYAKRQQMARYHNYVEAIIDLYVQHTYTQEPTRVTESEDLKEWWTDVDGSGTPITDFLKQCLALALAAGHTGVLMDATREEPVGPARADQRARPYLVRYVATAIPDWRTTNDTVTGIKLREAVPDGSIIDPPAEGAAAYRYLLWDVDGWARFDHVGDLVDGAVTALGIVPFDVVRPKRSVLRPFTGRSLFSNAKIVQALFNRHSEEDEVLRNQAFSLLTVEVPQDGDVEQARKQLGTELGSTRAVVVRGRTSYISPDMAVPEQVRNNSLQLIRELYRVAHMRYERDTLAAESAEAIRLQFKELNEFLQGMAAELQRLEHQLARFYFHWTSPTPEAAEAAYLAAKVSVSYPDEFFLADLRLDLDAWAQAITMDLGDTMTRRLKKKAVRRVEPEISVEDAKVIDAEIDKQDLHPEVTAVGTAAAKMASGAKSRLNTLLGTTSGRSG